MKSLSKIIGASTVAVAAAFPLSPAWAAPADYVYVPTVTYGEREIDFKAGTGKISGVDRETDSSLGYGYGVTDKWFTEFYGKYKKADGNGTAFDAFEWENKFQLTQTGEYPVDFGLITEIERPRDRREGYEVKFGPLFQTEVGKTQLNLNVLFQRNYRAAEANPLKLGYQVQARYRWIQALDFGVQGFGDFGKWNHFAPRSEQSHIFGPAIFGKIPLGGRHSIVYNAAYLASVGSAPHSNTFRTQIEYEF